MNMDHQQCAALCVMYQILKKTENHEGEMLNKNGYSVDRIWEHMFYTCERITDRRRSTVCLYSLIETSHNGGWTSYFITGSFCLGYAHYNHRWLSTHVLSLSAITRNWRVLTVISDIRVNCFYYCLIYVRDAHWQKSQNCPRVLSVTCPRERKQPGYDSNLRHQDVLCRLPLEMPSDAYVGTVREYSQWCVH